MNTPSNKEAQGRYEVRRGKDGKLEIYLKDYNCRVATFAKGIGESEREGFGDLLNSHSTESAERERLIKRTRAVIIHLELQIKQMEHLGYEIESRGDALELFKDLLHHLRGNGNE